MMNTAATTSQPKKEQDDDHSSFDDAANEIEEPIPSSSENDNDDDEDDHMMDSDDKPVARLPPPISSSLCLRQRNAIYSKRKYYKKKAFLERLHQTKDDLKLANRKLRTEHERLQNLLQQAHQTILLKIMNNRNPLDQTSLGLGGVSGLHHSKPSAITVNPATRQHRLGYQTALPNSVGDNIPPHLSSAMLDTTGNIDPILAQLAFQQMNAQVPATRGLQVANTVNDPSGLERTIAMLSAKNNQYQSMHLQEQLDRSSITATPFSRGNATLFDSTPSSLQLLLHQQQQRTAIASLQQRSLLPSNQLDMNHLNTLAMLDSRAIGGLLSNDNIVGSRNPRNHNALLDSLLEQGIRDSILQPISSDTTSATIGMLNRLQRQNDVLLSSRNNVDARIGTNNNATARSLLAMGSQLARQQPQTDRELLIRQLLMDQQQQDMSKTQRYDRF